MEGDGSVNKRLIADCIMIPLVVLFFPVVIIAFLLVVLGVKLEDWANEKGV